MKYILTIISAFLLSSNITIAQTSVKQIPGLEGGNFTSIVEFSDTLYASTISSEVFFSADNGITWQKDTRFSLSWSPAFSITNNSFLITDTFRDQLYLGSNTGLTIYSPTDGFKQPETIPEFWGNRGGFGDMIVTESALFASYRYSPTSQGDVITSTDGGLTWTTHDSPGRYFEHMAVAESGLVAAAAGDDLFISASGVSDFVEIDFPNQQNSLITDITISGDNIFVSTYADGIYLSSDDGSSWTNILEDAAYSITTLSNGNLVAGGLDGHVFLSSDNGANWSDIDLGVISFPAAHQGISDVLELSDGTLFGSMLWGHAYAHHYQMPSPGIMKSTDSGNSWESSNSGLTAQIIAQTFYNAAEDEIYIYAVGSGVYKWNTDTEAWESVGNSGSPEIAEHYHQVPQSAGWAPIEGNIQLGKHPETGELWLVSKLFTLHLDAETNEWTDVEHDPIDFLSPASIGFSNDGTPYIHESLGLFQGIYTTTDAATWTKIETFPNPANISSFSAKDKYLSYFDNYAFDEEVGIHLSTDGGESFTHIQENREGHFGVGGYYLDVENNEIVTTINLSTWPTESVVEQYNLETGSMNEINFTSSIEINSLRLGHVIQLPNDVIVVNARGIDPVTFLEYSAGYFYQDEDNWVPVGGSLPTETASEIIVAGDNSLLLRFDNELYLVSLDGNNVGTSTEPETAEIPSQLRVYPNYPNPFNPTTNISFDLPATSHTKISIYSVLGSLVKTIDLGTKSAGHHQFTFDASDLSSGMYFYSVHTGNSFQSGKMTLIK